MLVGRSRAIRQHLRSSSFTTLWVIEDWGLEWTVICHGGYLDFHRGRAGKPQITYTWPTAEEFLAQVESGKAVADQPRIEGDSTLRGLAARAVDGFMDSLPAVLANPVADEGERVL